MSTPWKTPHLSDSPEVTWDVEMTLLFLVSAGKEQQEQRIATKMVFHHVYIITNLHVLQSLDVFFLPLCCVCVCHITSAELFKYFKKWTWKSNWSNIFTDSMALGLPSNPCWDDNVPYRKRVFSDENGQKNLAIPSPHPTVSPQKNGCSKHLRLQHRFPLVFFPHKRCRKLVLREDNLSVV